MAEKQGFLVKEGLNIRNWKKRWCVLKNGDLVYSKSQNGGELGVIHIGQASAIRLSDARPKKKFLFEIVTPTRTYYLCALSEVDRVSWIKELNNERERQQNRKSVAQKAPEQQVQKPAEPAKIVTADDFVILNLIGKGSFGKVFQVRKKDTGKIYAMKVLNKQAILDRNELQHTKAEKSILEKLCHPFLVNLNYSFQTPDKLYFIMDYVNGGELFFHLSKDKKFTEERVRFYAAEIVCGLEYLQNRGVLYRDLKPENILLTSDGHICMTDFGISKEGLTSDDSRTATFCGTPEYLAPEVLEGQSYGKAVDWWSFGTLIYEMFTGLPPFYADDVQQMYAQIMTAKLSFPSHIPADARALISELLNRDPDRRLQDPKLIKAHPFFKGIDFEKLVGKELAPPFVPPVKNAEDISQIDESFTMEDPTLTPPEQSTLSQADQEQFVGFNFVK